MLNHQGCLMTLQARLADDADLIEEHLGAHHRNFGCALFCCPERTLVAGGAMDADSRGFAKPVHVEDEEGAQGEADEQQENEDRS